MEMLPLSSYVWIQLVLILYPTKAQVLNPSVVTQSGYVILSPSNITDNNGLHGNSVYDRGIHQEDSGTWIDLQSDLTAGRLDEFDIYISGTYQPGTQIQVRNLWLQIWRPVNGTEFELVWEQEVEVETGTLKGLLYKYKVGNRPGQTDSFNTMSGDMIGWTFTGPPGLVSHSFDGPLPDVGYRNLNDPQMKPVVGQVYMFNITYTQAVFSVAVRISTQPFVDQTLSQTGCSCIGDPQNKDCACCQAVTQENPYICTCPSVTWPGQCTGCHQMRNCESEFTCDIMINQGCFQIETNQADFNTSYNLCMDQPSSLYGNIQTDVVFEKVIEMYHTNTSKVWTGAYVKDYDWQWVLVDKTKELRLQGCFSTGQSSTNLERLISNLQNVNSESCIQHCDNLHYDYAGVHTTQNGQLQCACGKQFHKLNPELNIGECVCSTNNSQLCGGNKKEVIFHTQGISYSNFDPQQPLTGDGCAVLDINKKRWVKTNCLSNQMGYVCEYPGILLTMCKGYDRIYINDRCLMYFNESVNWYEAVYRCSIHQGHLVKVNVQTLDTNLMTSLQSLSTVTTWWIGLTNRAFVWSDDSNSPVTTMFQFFGPNEPAGNGDCVVIDVMSNYSWMAVDCKQQAEYYCKRDHDDCKSQPCKNGGTCRNKQFDFECDCPPKWEGKTCNKLDGPLDDTTTSATTTSAPPPDQNKDGAGLTSATIIGISIAVVLFVIIAIIVVAVLVYRSRKMQNELKELKLSHANIKNNAYGVVNEGGSFHLTRQESVYDHIDDTYHRLDTDRNDSHYYKGIGTDQTPDDYQELQDKTPNSTGAAYQHLHKDDPNYQGLVEENKPEDSGPPVELQDKTLNSTEAAYQHLHKDDPNYQGLVEENKPENTAPPVAYAQLSDATNNNVKAPDLPPPRSVDSAVNITKEDHHEDHNEEPPETPRSHQYLDLGNGLPTEGYAYTYDDH